MLELIRERPSLQLQHFPGRRIAGAVAHVFPHSRFVNRPTRPTLFAVHADGFGPEDFDAPTIDIALSVATIAFWQRCEMDCGEAFAAEINERCGQGENYAIVALLGEHALAWIDRLRAIPSNTRWRSIFPGQGNSASLSERHRLQ